MHFLRNAIQDPVFQDAMAEKGNIFVGNISLGVMIFFAAADPEGNCHENASSLAMETESQIPSVPFSSLTDLPFPFTEKAM